MKLFKPKILLSLIAIAVVFACVSLLSACGPSTTVKASAKQTTAKSVSKVSADVSVKQVSTAETAAEAAIPAAPTKTIAAMPVPIRLDRNTLPKFPDRYGYVNCSLNRYKPKPNGFKGIGHDHYARADV